MDDAYKKYIKREKISGIIHTLSSSMLQIISDDAILSEEDGIYIMKQACNRVVAILAKRDQEIEEENNGRSE